MRGIVALTSHQNGKVLSFKGYSCASVYPVKDLSSTSFGYLIAFLLPGIFGLYALSFWFPQMNVLLQPILKADTSVGPSFIFLVVAVGIGVCISGLRYFIFEKGLYRKSCLLPDVYRGMGSERLAMVRAFVDEHYRYH